jgi:predicted aconitase with swiveling domain
MGRGMRGRVLAGGTAQGRALVLDEPLSFWGGVDPGSGAIIDARHPQLGASVVGRVLVMTSGRGSSSSASVLAETLRAGSAPTAVLLGAPDLILAVGAAVAEELYGSRLPVIQLDRDDLASIADGAPVSIREGGEVSVG